MVTTFVQDGSRVAIGLFIGASLTGLAIWQARSLTLGFFFMAAFVLALLLLFLASTLLLRLLATLPRSRFFTIRNALSNLRRPGNYTISMTVAIGIGVMVIVSIAVIKNSLLASLGERLPTDAPSFFFIDIQPDQRARFEHVLAQWVDGSDYELTPVVRSRLSAIEGQPVDPEEYRGKRNGWYFTRSYVLTSLMDLPDDNTIADGEWWKDGGQIGVSVEDEAAKNLGVDIGSTLEFNIQGAPLLATVESTRKVDWSSFSTNFFMILSPNALEGVPMTYIATARVSKNKEVPLQRALVATLPNVTAINVGDVLRNISNLLQQLAWAIQGIALLCIGNGAIVMIAALSTTRYRRVYEAAILKALGGTRRGHCPVPRSGIWGARRIRRFDRSHPGQHVILVCSSILPGPRMVGSTTPAGDLFPFHDPSHPGHRISQHLPVIEFSPSGSLTTRVTLFPLFLSPIHTKFEMCKIRLLPKGRYKGMIIRLDTL